MQIHISRNGETYGPYTPAQIEILIHAGQIESSDEVWVQSSEWEPVSALGSMVGAVASGSLEAVTPRTSLTVDRLVLSPPVRETGSLLTQASMPLSRELAGIGEDYDGEVNLSKML